MRHSFKHFLFLILYSHFTSDSLKFIITDINIHNLRYINIHKANIAIPNYVTVDSTPMYNVLRHNMPASVATSHLTSKF